MLPTDTSSGVEAGARLILQSFDQWADDFRRLTAKARIRFEQRQWREGQHDSVERLALYQRSMAGVVRELQELVGTPHVARPQWSGLKAAFQAEVAPRGDLELALTFFSSVGRRFFDTVGVDPGIEFLDAPVRPVSVDRVVRRFIRADSTVALLTDALNAYRFSIDYEDLPRDCCLVADRIERAVGGAMILGLDVADTIFFRNKAAYLVGRLLMTDGELAFALALLNDERRSGITVDAVLLTEDDVSIVFSYTRSYFSVATERPRDLVAFLQQVLPRKPVSDLYIAIGHHKRAKTELYRYLLAQMAATEEQFDFAPGARGMVMIVFTMPSSDMVFKVFRDQFDFPKFITRQQVVEKYQLVFEHDRAGRLVDAQEFTDLEFDRARFPDGLLHELQEQARGSVEVRSNTVVLRHVYTERRVRPLDLYLREANLDAAVRDLAATNIFPGDLLLKNFGVTRHGRVAFYDYDEISLLTDCTFRRLPVPRDLQEELRATPWYNVNEGDVFPEEFESFLGLTGILRAQFLLHHRYLLGVDFWRDMQQDLRAGKVVDIFPYPSDKWLLAAAVPTAATSEVFSNHA